jgi:hypothetical protein
MVVSGTGYAEEDRKVRDNIGLCDVFYYKGADLFDICVLVLSIFWLSYEADYFLEEF